MEKIIWVKSIEKKIGSMDNDGLDKVNQYLAEGWTVKQISACAVGGSVYMGQAYVVIEKKDL